MREYTEADSARHETLRDKFRSERRLVDLEYDPLSNCAFKIIARADRAKSNGQVYLSPKVYNALVKCQMWGIGTVLVIDDTSALYKFDVEDGWIYYGPEGNQTAVYCTLISKLTRL